MRLLLGVRASDDTARFQGIVAGDSGVGKSCLLTRYTRRRYPDPPCIKTIGFDFQLANLRAEGGQHVRMTFCDLGGPPRPPTCARSEHLPPPMPTATHTHEDRRVSLSTPQLSSAATASFAYEHRRESPLAAVFP